jgi:MoaA/NifB/PqqE/SkfB family radical SAM enzyme
MRNHEMHFEKMIGLLRVISENTFHFKTKINTVLTKQNEKDIPAIGRLLENYRVDLWSIYEYWPLGQAADTVRKYRMEETETDQIFSKIKKTKYQNNMCAELGKYINRYQSYFFTTPQGTVYINSRENLNEYMILGDIFDSRTIEKYEYFNISTMRKDLCRRYNR